jgi:hypothetical protein
MRSTPIAKPRNQRLTVSQSLSRITPNANAAIPLIRAQPQFGNRIAMDAIDRKMPATTSIVPMTILIATAPDSGLPRICLPATMLRTPAGAERLDTPPELAEEKWAPSGGNSMLSLFGDTQVANENNNNVRWLWIVNFSLEVLTNPSY